MSEGFIPFSRPYFDDSDVEAVAAVIRSGWWTTGPRTREFEEAFAVYQGAEHAVALNSCTAGLHLALLAAGVGEGDLVLTSTYTFAATAEVGLYLGAVPVLFDIDPRTMNLEASALAAAVECAAEGDRGAVERAADEGRVAPGTARVLAGRAGARVGAVVPVHFAGLACDMDAVGRAAAAGGAPVIADAAHAVETTSGGAHVGALGDVCAFSFYATKNLSTGEGGMVTTDDGELAERVRRLSLHGISKDAWNRYTAEGSWYYEIMEAGYKYNLTDIAAALGLAQLGRLDRLHDRRARIATRYSEAFADLGALTLPAAPDGDTHAWHLYVVRLRPDTLRIDRARFIEELRERGVGSSVHFIPLHLHPLHRDMHGYRRGDFPAAEAAYDAAVSLPLYPSLTDGEVERVCEAVRAICEENVA